MGIITRHGSTVPSACRNSHRQTSRIAADLHPILPGLGYAAALAVGLSALLFVPPDRNIEEVTRLRAARSRNRTCASSSPGNQREHQSIGCSTEHARGDYRPIARDAAKGGDRPGNKRDESQGRHLDRQKYRGRGYSVDRTTERSQTAMPQTASGRALHEEPSDAEDHPVWNCCRAGTRRSRNLGNSDNPLQRPRQRVRCIRQPDQAVRVDEGLEGTAAPAI